MPIDPTEVLPAPIQQGLVKPAPPITYPLPKRIALDGTFPMMSGKVIDEFEHQNWFLMNAPLIELVSTVGGGPALEYKFGRTVNETGAASSEFNSETTETYIEWASVTTTIANLSSGFSIDRRLMELSNPRDMVRRQLTACGQGLNSLFNEMVIRGDSAVPSSPNDMARGRATFDGLHKIITQESFHTWDTEDDVIDLTGLGYTHKIDDSNSENQIWMDVAAEFMMHVEELNPRPTFILGNKDLITALSQLGRRCGSYQPSYDQFGHKIDNIDGISLINMGRRNAKADWIIKTEHAEIETRENPNGAKEDTYVTRAYVGSFGENAVSCLAPPGPMIKITPPDLTTSGHVKKWDIDMHIGMTVFSRHSVGMFDKICLPKRLVQKPWNVKDRVPGVY